MERHKNWWEEKKKCGSYLSRCIFGIRNSDVHRDEQPFVAREDRGRCICIGRKSEKHVSE